MIHNIHFFSHQRMLSDRIKGNTHYSLFGRFPIKRTVALNPTTHTQFQYKHLKNGREGGD